MQHFMGVGTGSWIETQGMKQNGKVTIGKTCEKECASWNWEFDQTFFGFQFGWATCMNTELDPRCRMSLLPIYLSG